jgi:hypothetical protein
MEIKRAITDFTNFDVENDYYQVEDKEELVRLFKKILFEDDTTVRQFLKAFFQSTKELADEYSLLEGDEEAQEEPVEEPSEETEEPEDAAEETPEPETQEEAVDIRKAYRSIAANILYE